MDSQLRNRLVGPLALFGAWLVFFSPALLFGRVFYFRDLFFMQRPLREVVAKAMRDGRVPYLDLALNVGQPMVSDPIYAVFYPANLLYLVLPFELAWNGVLAGHVLWGGLGLYLLARTLGAERAGALAGAAAFAFGGPLLSTLTYYGLLIAASWVPWILALACLAWRRGGVWLACCAVSIGMLGLVGEPTVLATVGGVVGFGWVIALVRASDRSRRLAHGLVIGTVGILLAAVQLVPTLAWLPETQRGDGLPFRQSAAWWSLHPARLAETLVPRIHGNALGVRAEEFWGAGLSDAGFPLLVSLYLGWIPLLVGLLAWRSRAGRMALIGSGSFLVLSLGHWLPGYYLLYRAIPLLWITRYPEKFALFASVALAVACALGWGELRRGRSTIAFVAVAVGSALLVALGASGWLDPPAGLSADQLSARWLAIGQAIGLAVAALLAIRLAAIARWTRGITLFVLPAMLLLELAGFTWVVPATRPGPEERSVPALLREVPELAGATILHLGEVDLDPYYSSAVEPLVSMRNALHPYTGLRWDVRYGVAEDIPRSGWRGAAERRERLLRGFPGPDSVELMRELGIAYVVALRPVTAPELVRIARVVEGTGPAMFVYAIRPGPYEVVRSRDDTVVVSWNERSPDRLLVEVSSTDAAPLVVRRNAIRGWTATLDDVKTDLGATKSGLLRVEIPPGEHRLDLRYRPPGLIAGIVLSVFGLLCVALLSKRAERGQT